VIGRGGDFTCIGVLSIATLNWKTVLLTGRCSVAPQNRRDCGSPGISRKQCEDKGCCFDDAIHGAIWCFVTQGFSLSIITHSKYT